MEGNICFLQPTSLSYPQGNKLKSLSEMKGFLVYYIMELNVLFNII
ncbi:MAG: hypothetical protein K0S44_271 [Bacteroidetes bacterium]|jgi:hypothetical protein|nr:hypothetical protein [Bacteroidota bacterium]